MLEAAASARSVPDSLLAALSEFLAERVGLRFPAERWCDLERGLRSAASEFGHADAESCARSLLGTALTRGDIEVLASHLTVGETYFFRDRKSFECLEQHVLPGLVRSRRGGERRLRIWSAGCSTGEEPYSIAMVLTRAIPDLADWNVSILATDINPSVLRKAALGIYREWSFRDTPEGVRERFFTRSPDAALVLESRIRSMVTFAYLNLAEDNYPAVENGTNAMDLVFCRNVLMYFDAAHGRRIMQRLARSLLDGGWMFVSPVEISQIAPPSLVTVNLPGAIAYRKGALPAAPGQHVFTMPVDPGATAVLPAFAEPLVLEPGAEIPAAKLAQPDVQSSNAYDEAVELYALGGYSAAVETLQRSLARGAGDVKTLALLARCHANQGNLDAAAEWCRKALAADKLNPAWNYLLATILEERGAVEEAAVALRRALYLDSDHALAHFALGNQARRWARRAESERHFRNALAALARHSPDEILAESEGITAGRLAEIIRSTTSSGTAE